jgi:hypothetical protein
VVRSYLPNLYETFDFPESTEVKSVRDVTTVPTQALFLMNSRFVIDQSRSAAAHLLAENLATPQERVTRVYREVLGRLPTPAEIERALVFIHSAQETAESQPAEPAPTPTQGRGRGRGGFGGGFQGQGGRGASGGRGAGRGVIGAGAGGFAQGGAAFAQAGRGRGGRGGPVEAPLARVSPEESAWEHFYQALFAGAEFRYRG